MMHFWKNSIYPLLSTVLALGWKLRHFLDKVTLWHFQSTSKDLIWPKRILNYMHGSKSAILAIFQRALKNYEKVFFFWVPMNIKKDWKALECASSFMLSFILFNLMWEKECWKPSRWVSKFPFDNQHEYKKKNADARFLNQETLVSKSCKQILYLQKRKWKLCHQLIW